jgi:flagellar biosynthesis chaperone FliJ
VLSVNELRILQAVLRLAQDQIEEAEAALGAVSPRTSELAGQLARLKEIRRLIQDERQTVDAQLHAGQAGQP